MDTNVTEKLEMAESNGIGVQSFLLLVLALAAGAFAAIDLLPALAPNLSSSLAGSEAKAYWFLSRGTAVVSFCLLWLSMAFGLIVTNRMARIWPGGPTAVGVHEYASILGLAFGLFHGLILLGDRYINYTLTQVLVPFMSQNYRPVWVGLGQVAIYIWGLLVLSFYLRKRIGTKTWRVIHYASFFTFLLVFIHGIASGTDTGTHWGNGLYWISGGSLLFLFFYRLLFDLE